VSSENAAAPGRRLRVEAVFQGVEEQHVQRIAAEMIDRAHELANLPDCQCDVDVSVEDSQAEDSHSEPVGESSHAHLLGR
jgi:hypothetical protein